MNDRAAWVIVLAVLGISLATNAALLSYLSRQLGYNFLLHYGLLNMVGVAVAAWLGAFAAVAMVFR